ncbi:MAG: peptidoglycan editing factor PgeF [Chlorobiaceae bacterium]|nr:peptidoglycan editing factor PgeF [Chlorobiaceae bacterium]
MISHSGLFPLYPTVFSQVTGLVALQTTRSGGISSPPWDSLNLGLNTMDDSGRIYENYLHLCRFLNISAEAIVTSEQVHGTSICRITGPGKVSGYDGLITDRKGIYIGILTADCYPVLIHDTRTGACGAAHAGWQGTVGRIAYKTVHAMKGAFGTRPEDCLAWVGTGISAEHYEIGNEVARQFDSRYLTPSPAGNGKQLLDLSAASRDQLLEAGIPALQLECSAFCSYRDREQFFSYRRDNGSTGRMLSLIGLRPSA